MSSDGEVNKRDLGAVMAALYADEINCGISSFWDSGFTVWIGDNMNGRKSWETFHPFDNPNWLADAAEWLWEASRALAG
jgi:hypothetical protein